MRHSLPTFGSFIFFQTSLWHGVDKILLQKQRNSNKSELRHLFQCCILIPRKCQRRTPFQHTVQCWGRASPLTQLLTAHLLSYRIDFRWCMYVLGLPIYLGAKFCSLDFSFPFSNFYCRFLNPNTYFFQFERSENKLKKHFVTRNCSNLSLFE